MGFFSFSLATSSKFENLAIKVGFQLSFQLVFQLDFQELFQLGFELCFEQDYWLLIRQLSNIVSNCVAM